MGYTAAIAKKSLPLGDVLAKILQTGSNLATLSAERLAAQSCTQTPASPTLPLCSPPITFDVPQPISSMLIDLGLAPHIANQLSDNYMRAASELRRHAMAIAEAGCQDLAKLPQFPKGAPTPQVQRDMLRALQGYYESKTKGWIEETFEAARKHSISRPLATTTYSAFNNAFIPFLELYFKHEAYPTRADRSLIAHKSMMTARQIEVWFQNHRRRARKEGIPVVRRHPDDRTPVDLESLAKSMPELFVPGNQRSDPLNSDWDDEEEEEEVMADLSDVEAAPVWMERHARQAGAPDVLNADTPTHAFPTVFSECGSYHPFPTTDEGFMFPPPLWTRRPATQRVNRPSPDFEDLTARFERLSLLTPLMTGSRKTGSGKHSRPTSMEPSSAKRQYPLPTTFTPITPPIGRHPAFVPTLSESCVSPSASKPTIPIVRAPDSRLHAFQTPAPESPPVSLMPSSTPSSSVPVYKKTLPRRQVARLPRRTPQSQSVAHRISPIHPVPTPSSPSSSPSVSSGSRTSSFESLFSSHTRTSSNGSDTSLPNMPITPTFSPTPLQPPAPVTATDFSFTDDLFGDSLLDFSFPPNAFQMNGFGNASKPIQTPSYNDFNFNFTPSQFLQA